MEKINKKKDCCKWPKKSPTTLFFPIFGRVLPKSSFTLFSVQFCIIQIWKHFWSQGHMTIACVFSDEKYLTWLKKGMFYGFCDCLGQSLQILDLLEFFTYRRTKITGCNQKTHWLFTEKRHSFYLYFRINEIPILIYHSVYTIKQECLFKRWWKPNPSKYETYKKVLANETYN